MIKVKIETVEKIQKFIDITSSFAADVDVQKGHYVLDGKSIMGLYSLDLSEPIYVGINTDEEEEVSKFNELMNEFAV